MTSPEIESRIHAEIAGRWHETNLHGVDLRASLVKPEKIRIINRRISDGELRDEVIEVWLVLEEHPRMPSGYKIVFDEGRGSYGLATPGFPEDKYPVLYGFYGDFWTTFTAM